MTNFVDVFGGGIVSPTDLSYTRLTITTPAVPVQLQWPLLAQEGDSVAARIVEVTSASGSPVVVLPDARDVSTGQDVLFRNLGPATVIVQKNDASSLLTLAPGEIKYTYLTDNTTAAGIWTVVAFGATVGTLDASQLAGLGLTAISTTLNGNYTASTINSSFTIQASDRAHLYVFTGGAQTVTLQPASAYGNGFFFMLANEGSGAITIQPSGIETIDTASNIQINPGESTIVITTGSTWFTVGRGRSVLFNFTQLVKNVAGGTDVTLTTTEASNKILKFIGTLTASINVIVPNVVSLYIVDNQTTGPFTLTVKTLAGSGIVVQQSNRNILYCDGTNVLQAITVAVATGGFSDGTASNPSINFASDTATGFYRPGLGILGVTTGGVSRLTINSAAATFTVPISAPNLDSTAIQYAIALG